MHRIVIVGGGAGGLELATRLGRRLGRRGKAAVTLVDANLTHLWKPLLHEVAAGSLDAPQNEINYVVQGKWSGFEFQLGRFVGLDRARRAITLCATLDEHGTELIPGREIGYDTLVLAVGSVTNDFGTPGAAEHCVFLDTAAQADRFHRLLLGHYLAAHAAPGDAAELAVAIVGAGATGVELAAELCHAARGLAAYGLASIRPDNLHVTLLDAGPRILPALPERIGADAQRILSGLGVVTLTSAAVKEVTADAVVTSDGRRVPAPLKVWAAGIRAPRFLKDIDGLETNRIDQLVVHRTLQTTRDPRIFAFGDCAACPMGEGDGRTVPPRAQAAHQQANLLARSLEGHLAGRPLRTYEYRDLGSLVSLSGFDAVGSLMGNLMGTVKVEGWLARMFYISLYRMHQVAVVGLRRTALRMLGDLIERRTEPRLKLH